MAVMMLGGAINATRLYTFLTRLLQRLWPRQYHFDQANRDALMKSIKTIALAASLALSGMLPPLIHAHDAAYLDTQAAPHGGQLRMAGASHFELVVVKDSKTAKDNAIVVYVTDHVGTRIPTAGAFGSVTLLSGKSKVSAALNPDGDNKLTGRATYASAPDLMAVVTVRLAGVTARLALVKPSV